jgi:hypothetical protein
MFMLRSTHRQFVDAIRASAKIVIDSQQREIDRLRGQLAERQVKAVRNDRTGRFEKREC